MHLNRPVFERRGIHPDSQPTSHLANQLDNHPASKQVLSQVVKEADWPTRKKAEDADIFSEK